MATVSEQLSLPRFAVFEALATPETYPHWLVGCRAIRSVDDGWPRAGTRFHHRVGLVGPLTVADDTKSLGSDPPTRLSLEVRARPFGRGRVTFRLSDAPDGGTVVELDEAPIGLMTPARPLVDPITARRNRRSLRNLADYLERGRSHAAPTA